MDDIKRYNINLKQKEKYKNNAEYRLKKQQNAKKYYEKKKFGTFEITFSNNTKKIYFE